MTSPVIIGMNFYKFRKQKGMSQESAASEIEVSVSYLRKIESGNANTTIKILDKMAKCMRVRTQDLFDENLFEEQAL